jgi:hypothetical protein
LIRPRRILPHAAARRSRGQAAAWQDKIDEACAGGAPAEFNGFFMSRAQTATPIQHRMFPP